MGTGAKSAQSIFLKCRQRGLVYGQRRRERSGLASGQAAEVPVTGHHLGRDPDGEIGLVRRKARCVLAILVEEWVDLTFRLCQCRRSPIRRVYVASHETDSERISHP